MSHPKHLMPRCTARDVRKITAAIEAMRGARRSSARAFAAEVTPRGLCEILHAMRRWYSFNTGAMARRILKHHAALSKVMDLGLPVGAWRGFHLPRTRDCPALRAGREGDLPVTRNGACSSWTADRARADQFSGASRRNVGVVVELLGGDDARAFIAPVSHTEPWFNDLYAAAIGRSFRWKEEEFAIHAEWLRVRIDAVKR